MTKKKSEIAVIHFNPIESYPPVMNTIRYFEKNFENERISLFTVKVNSNSKRFSTPSKKTKIYRIGKIDASLPLVRRMLSYLTYNFASLFYLVFKRPGTVIYYETFSAFAPIVYKRIFNRRSRIFAHYHEYVSPAEFEKGMLLAKWLHRLERRNYHHLHWISETNADRLQLFLKDNPRVPTSILHVLRNYPPANWLINKEKEINFPIKIVSVGSIGLHTLYAKEFAKWVIEQNGAVLWDIFSLNVSDEVSNYFNTLNTPHINLKGGVFYDNIPGVLSDYDVGVVLYKGHIPNVTYCVSNKLFEYHVCGLDTWFSSEMLSTKELITHNTYPKILEVDFGNLVNFSLQKAIQHDQMSYFNFAFNCESELNEFMDALQQWN